MELIDIEKNKFNRLRKRFQKFTKLLSNIDSENIKNDDKLIQDIFTLNQGLDNLINLLELTNIELIKKNDETISEELQQIIDNDKNADKIINKFLPAMLLYQMYINNQ